MIRTIGKCALLGVACMLFRARRKSKNESRAFITRADARARVPRAQRGPQGSPKGPRCILRGSVSWATVAVAVAAIVTTAPPRNAAAITAFFASRKYPLLNVVCRQYLDSVPVKSGKGHASCMRTPSAIVEPGGMARKNEWKKARK